MALRQLLENLGTILNLINTDRMVHVEKLEQLCLDTAVMVREKMPWVQFSPTVHEVLAHSPQLIRNNGGRGLLAFSEEPSEGTHKMVKEIRRKYARQMNLKVNLQDVMHKLWMFTDPARKAFDPVLTCSECLKNGHTIRSCPKKNPKLSAEDKMFDEYTYDEDDYEDGHEGEGDS